jgi:hypothetical protein
MTVATERKFYKYMSAPTAQRVLDTNSFRWALPKTFNDPFDVQFDLRVEYDRSTANRAPIYSFAANIFVTARAGTAFYFSCIRRRA